MSDNNKNFDGTVQSLFTGMTNFMTTKTVVGEAININNTIILPLVDVSFGMGAGSKNGGGKETSSGGMGGKMSPSAVLVIKDGDSKLVNIKNQDAVTKILDMVPELVSKFTDKSKSKDSDIDMSDEEIIDVAKSSVDEK
ncbi:MAG: GerW family sporulation protein [Lachnospiraceae bacterium]